MLPVLPPVTVLPRPLVTTPPLTVPKPVSVCAEPSVIALPLSAMTLSVAPEATLIICEAAYVAAQCRALLASQRQRRH